MIAGILALGGGKLLFTVSFAILVIILKYVETNLLNFVYNID